MKGHAQNFFMVSNRIFDFSLKPKAFCVYCALLSFADNETLACFPSRRLLAERCRMDKKTVDSALRELANKGLIKKERRMWSSGRNTSCLYSLCDLLDRRVE